MHSKLRLSVLASLILLLGMAKAPAQELGTGLRSFHNFSLGARIADDWQVRYGQLYAMAYDFPTRLQFLQQNIELEWRGLRRFRATAYWRPTRFQFSNGTWSWIHITGLRLRYGKKRHGKWTNYVLRAERFSPQQGKYRYRFIGQVRRYLTRYRLPGKSALYAEGRLYYYLDGKPVDYFENGELIISQPPNDFHRTRLTLGLRSKVSKHLRFNLYGTWNKEFNNPLTRYRDINVPNQTGTAIQRDFSNYIIIGTSLSLRLDLRE